MKNGNGPTGIAYNSKLGFIGFDEGILDRVNDQYIEVLISKIQEASVILSKGDVLLIEQHMLGPNDKYIPVEFWDEIFYELKKITQRGIHCIQAAGNGGDNLDAEIYENKFNENFRDSGCIIVGAGQIGTNNRLNLSSFGSRVDAQGHGQHVFTLGHGDAKKELNNEMTSYFSGTSSASPIVAGAVALVSSIAKENGIIISPKEMREALRQTGSRPKNITDKNIGNLPDVLEILRYLKLSPVDQTP